jgi:hypothetical protein
MAVKIVDRLFIVAYGAAGPTAAEWTAYLDLMERQGIDRTMQLVVTDGGGPTAAQRRELDKLLAGRTMPMAVVSGSIRVRGVVSVLSWLNRRIRAFRPPELREALVYLGVPARRGDLIERELNRLLQELEGGRGT